MIIYHQVKITYDAFKRLFIESKIICQMITNRDKRFIDTLEVNTNIQEESGGGVDHL